MQPFDFLRALFGGGNEKTERDKAIALLCVGKCPPQSSEERSVKAALRLFRKRKAKNRFFIGACYFKLGELHRAVINFKKELARSPYGHQAAMAAHALAVCYRDGVGVKTDKELSRDYFFTEGQAGGEPRDVYWSGMCYYYGWGVPIEKEHGMDLWQKAAKQGDKLAAEQLARLSS